MPNSPADIAGGLPQLETLRQRFDNPDEPNVELVLVSIGGNDTGFSSIVQICLLPTNCAEHEQLWTAKAESLESELVETYKEIRSVVGDVPIVVVPYPEYISARSCDKLASAEEFAFVDRFVDVINGTVYRAARRAEVYVANTPKVFAGRALCDDDPAANLIVLAPPSGPSITGRLAPRGWAHSSMHPTTQGHDTRRNPSPSWQRR